MDRKITSAIFCCLTLLICYLFSHLFKGALHSASVSEEVEAWWACRVWCRWDECLRGWSSWTFMPWWFPSLRLCIRTSRGLWRAHHFRQKYAPELSRSCYIYLAAQHQLDRHTPQEKTDSSCHSSEYTVKLSGFTPLHIFLSDWHRGNVSREYRKNKHEHCREQQC